MTSNEAPDGGNTTKPMWSVLKEELRREVEEDGQMLETRQLIVRRLTAKALAGDIHAIREIFDRMEVKSASDATPDEGRRKLTFEWKNDDDATRADAGGSSSPSTNEIVHRLNCDSSPRLQNEIGARSMPGWDKERYAQDEEYRARLCEHSRKYYQAHKHDIARSTRTKRLQKHYGLSDEDYDTLLAKQGGACAICRRRLRGRLCVDHCHFTGLVRGLLCRKCNLGLGCLVDDAASLISAFAYLAYRMTQEDKAGTAAQRALVARAMLRAPPTRTTTPAMARRNESMRKALEAELSRKDMLREIVRKLTVEALGGNLDAIKEIFDRMHARPVERAGGGKTSVSMTFD